MSCATAMWMDRSPDRPAALIIASIVGSDDVFVVTAAAGVAGQGAIGVVLLFVPGSLLSQLVLMPLEAMASCPRDIGRVLDAATQIERGSHNGRRLAAPR